MADEQEVLDRIGQLAAAAQTQQSDALNQQLLAANQQIADLQNQLTAANKKYDDFVDAVVERVNNGSVKVGVTELPGEEHR